MFQRGRTLVLLSVFLLLSSASGGVSPSDSAQFPLTTFKEFEGGHSEGPPSIRSKVDLVTPGFSVLATSTGKIRVIPAEKRKLFQTLRRSDPDTSPAIDLYEKEIEVLEQGRSYWLPIQSHLLAGIKNEIRPGKIITLYLRCIGKLANERVYLVIHFSHAEEGAQHPGRLGT